jgi:dihydroorotate dehydrogenase (NAD+) catalytic subunit
MNSLPIDFAGVTLTNPVVLASGCVGFGREYSRYFDLNDIGAICVKGLTLHTRDGNPPPRVAETPSGMLNSVGLQNPGADAFIRDELPWLKQFNCKIIANISGNHPDEYAELAWKCSCAGVDMLEVNISCPNVKQGGIVFGVDPAAAAEVTRAVKNHSIVPVMVKLSPAASDIPAMAKAAADAGADALSLINTVPGMRIDIHTKRPVLYNNIGGLSGPAILPVAVRCVWQAAQAVDLPVLGMGGVSGLNDALELILAGARAVAVGTALFANPSAAAELARDLKQYCTEHGMTVEELSGAVKTW